MSARESWSGGSGEAVVRDCRYRLILRAGSALISCDLGACFSLHLGVQREFSRRVNTSADGNGADVGKLPMVQRNSRIVRLRL